MHVVLLPWIAAVARDGRPVAARAPLGRRRRGRRTLRRGGRRGSDAGSSASTSRSPSGSRGSRGARQNSFRSSSPARSVRAARDFDIALSGIEDTPARRAALAVSIPYYEFREVITVREGRPRSLSSRWPTCAAVRWPPSAARWPSNCCSLPRKRRHHRGFVRRRRASVLGSGGRARRCRAARQRPRRSGAEASSGPSHATGSVATGHTSSSRLGEHGAHRAVDETLRAAMTRRHARGDPTQVEGVNDDQPALHARLLGQRRRPPSPQPRLRVGRRLALSALAVRAALITLRALVRGDGARDPAGAALAIGRIYGGPLVRPLLAAYVELTARHAGAAAIVRHLLTGSRRWCGYRPTSRPCSDSGSTTRPTRARSTARARGRARGQLEAARSWASPPARPSASSAAPQAFRFALAPMTNDFVAMLKGFVARVRVDRGGADEADAESYATNIGSWVVPGVLCAALYLAMSLPLGQLARRLESRWKAPHRERRPARDRPLARSRPPRDPARRGPRGQRRRDRRAHGPVGIREDHGPARRRRLEKPDAGQVSAGRAGWCSSSTTCSSTSRLSRTWCSRPSTSSASPGSMPRACAAAARRTRVGHRADALPRETVGRRGQRVSIARALAVILRSCSSTSPRPRSIRRAGTTSATRCASSPRPDARCS